MPDGNNGPTTERTPNGRFTKGNPGRPRGARHKTTLAVEALLEGEAEGLTRKAVEPAWTAILRRCGSAWTNLSAAKGCTGKGEGRLHLYGHAAGDRRGKVKKAKSLQFRVF